MRNVAVFLLASIFLVSCSSSAPVTPEAEIVTVYSTPAAEPWLSELFKCANEQSIVLNVSSVDPEIFLRVGEPPILVLPSYQIAEEEILVVVNQKSAIQKLTLEDARELFARGSESAQVWAYASDADVQFVFDQLVMKERGVSSFAQVAVSPQQMSDVLTENPNAVGILPRSWMGGNLREVYSAGTAPVLAITKVEASGAIQNLLACLST